MDNSIRLSVDGKEIDSPDDVANTFNRFFSNIGNETEKTIPKGKTDFASYLKHNFASSFF